MAADSDYTLPTNPNGSSNGKANGATEPLGAAKAPRGGFRARGRTYRTGEPLPKRYERSLAAGVRHRDPSDTSPLVPPNFGRPVVPQIITFSSRLSMIANVYRNPDEAVKHSLENARIMRNDCSIMECLEARQRCTALLNWHLEPEDDKDPKQKKLVEDLTWVLNQIPRFAEYRRNLLEALWYGRYANQHAYGFRRKNGKRYTVINRWLPINGDKLAFRFDDGSGKYLDEQVGVKVGPVFSNRDIVTGSRKVDYTDYGPIYFLEAWERKRLAVHKHIIEDGSYEDVLSAGRIHGVGIRDRIYWTWFQKQETMAQLMEVIERTGTGFTIYWYPWGNAEAKSAAETAAENQSHENVLIMPRMPGDPSMDAFGIDRIEPSTGGIEALKSIIHEFFGHQIKRYILGQILSTESAATGLGSGVADLHKDSLSLVIEYDAINLEETITTEVVSQLKELNFPWAEEIQVRFKIDTKSEDADKKLGSIKQAWDMGCRIKAKDVMDVLGLSMPTAADEVLQNPAMMQQARLAAGKFEGQDQGQLEHLFGPLAGLLGGGAGAAAGGGEGQPGMGGENGEAGGLPGEGGPGGNGPSGGGSGIGPVGGSSPQQFARRRYEAGIPASPADKRQHQVGETKSINGVTYRLNENHRWVRDADGDGQGDESERSMGGDAPSPKKSKPTGFTTSKGSTYAIDEQGRTQRTKAEHIGHDRGDVGLKDASDQTFFLSPEDAQRIGMHNSLNKEAKARVLIRGNQALLVSWNEKEKRWGKDGHPIPLSNVPAMGAAPLEVWGMKEDKELGGMVPSKNHPGNEITKLDGGEEGGAGDETTLNDEDALGDVGGEAGSIAGPAGDADPAEDHAKRHSFVQQQLGSIDKGIAVAIARLHSTKTYQQGGEVATANLGGGHGKALYAQLQQAVAGGAAGGQPGPTVQLPGGQTTQAISAMGGYVVDLGEGRMGFASKAGSAVVWPPDASGQQKVSYTTKTGIVSEAAGLAPAKPTNVLPGGQSGIGGAGAGGPDVGGMLPGMEGDADAGVGEANDALGDEEIPEAELDEENDPKQLRQSADDARKKYESAVKLWESEYAKGLDAKGHAAHRSNVAATKALWKERERIASDSERKSSKQQGEQRKAAGAKEKEAMARLGIGPENLGQSGRQIRDAAAGEAEDEAFNKLDKPAAGNLPFSKEEAKKLQALGIDPAAAAGGVAGPIGQKEPDATAESPKAESAPAAEPETESEDDIPENMSIRQQRLVDLARGYMYRFKVSSTPKNRKALLNAIAKGHVRNPGEMRRVLATARKIHERGNIAKDDHPSLAESLRRKANREGRVSPKKQISDRASGHGIGESDYRQLVEDLYKEKRSHHDEYEAAKTAARKATGLSAKEIRQLEEQGFDSGSDHPKIRGLDVTAADLANNHPALGWERTADDAAGGGSGQDHGQKLWELLKEGKKNPPGKFSDDFLNEVDSFLMAQAESANRSSRGGASAGEGAVATDDDLSATPFRRRGIVKRYRRYRREHCEPTEAQKEAGNYKMRHVRLHGLDVSIENEKGTRRKPEWPELSAAYGYIKRTEGKDGDHVDVYVGPDEDSEIVYVVDQVTEAGRFDEHKCMVGWTNEKAACDAYLANYTKDWKLGPVTSMTVQQFKCWLEEGDTTRPVVEQVSKYAAKKTKPLGETPYGHCPKCDAPGVLRERRIDGNDRCANGHEYPSRDAVLRSEPLEADDEIWEDAEDAPK